MIIIIIAKVKKIKIDLVAVNDVEKEDAHVEFQIQLEIIVYQKKAAIFVAAEDVTLKNQ